MFFFFVCGEKTIRKELPEYKGLTCQCHNCGNMSGRVLKRRPFFTFCFIPLIPFSISGYKDISCRICNFNQPLEQRPDVQSMANGGGGGQPQRQQGGNQGWGGQQQQQHHKQGPPPPQQYQQQQRYG